MTPTVETMAAMYRSGMTMKQIAKETGRGVATVCRWLHAAGIETMARGQWAKGQEWSENRRAATPKKAAPARPVIDGVEVRGPKLTSHRAIGNKSISPHGYVVITTGRRKRQYEHILIAEKALGRPLDKGMVVHHINCIKTDNRPENLLICSIQYHLQLHARMRRDPHWNAVETHAKSL